MPTYRSITVSLVSQFDILTIPEYVPPPRVNENNNSSNIETNDDLSDATISFVDPNRSIVSVYIPIYPSSQFWLNYHISPPHPPGAVFYFKLYLDGTHLVSWGISERDNYAGKTMFGLFVADNAWGEIEKRVFCFGNNMNNARVEGMLELRVFRAKGRSRRHPVIASPPDVEGRSSGGPNPGVE